MDNKKFETKHIYDMITGKTDNGFWKEQDGRTKEDHERFWKKNTRLQEVQKAIENNEIQFNSMQDIDLTFKALDARKDLNGHNNFKDFLRKQSIKLMEQKEPNHQAELVIETQNKEKVVAPPQPILEEVLETAKPSWISNAGLYLRKGAQAAAGLLLAGALAAGAVKCTSDVYMGKEIATAGEPTKPKVVKEDPGDKLLREVTKYVVKPKKPLTPAEKAEEAKIRKELDAAAKPKPVVLTPKQIEDAKKRKKEGNKLVKNSETSRKEQEAARKEAMKRSAAELKKAMDPSVKDVLEFSLEDLVKTKSGKIARLKKGDTSSYFVNPKTSHKIVHNYKGSVKVEMQKGSLEYYVNNENVQGVEFEVEEGEITLKQSVRSPKYDKKGNFVGMDNPRTTVTGDANPISYKLARKLLKFSKALNADLFTDEMTLATYRGLVKQELVAAEKQENLIIKANLFAKVDSIYKEAKQMLPGRFNKEAEANQEALTNVLGEYVKNRVQNKLETEESVKQLETKYGLAKGKLVNVFTLGKTKGTIAELKEQYKSAKTDSEKVKLGKAIIDNYNKIKHFNGGVEEEAEKFSEKVSPYLAEDIRNKATKSKTNADWIATQKELKQYGNNLKKYKAELELLVQKGSLEHQIANYQKLIKSKKGSKYVTDRAQAYQKSQELVEALKRAETLEQGTQYKEAIANAELEMYRLKDTLPTAAITPKTTEPVVDPSKSVVTLPQRPKNAPIHTAKKGEKGLFMEDAEGTPATGYVQFETEANTAGAKGLTHRGSYKLKKGALSLKGASAYENTEYKSNITGEKVSNQNKSHYVDGEFKFKNTLWIPFGINTSEEEEVRKVLTSETTLDNPDIITNIHQDQSQKEVKKFTSATGGIGYKAFKFKGIWTEDNQEVENITEVNGNVSSILFNINQPIYAGVKVNADTDSEALEAYLEYEFGKNFKLKGFYGREDIDVRVQVQQKNASDLPYTLISDTQNHFEIQRYGSGFEWNSENLKLFGEVIRTEANGAEVPSDEEYDFGMGGLFKIGNTAGFGMGGKDSGDAFYKVGFAYSKNLTQEQAAKIVNSLSTESFYKMHNAGKTESQMEKIVNDANNSLYGEGLFVVQASGFQENGKDAYTGKIIIPLGSRVSLGFEGQYDSQNEIEHNYGVNLGINLTKNKRLKLLGGYQKFDFKNGEDDQDRVNVTARWSF